MGLNMNYSLMLEGAENKYKIPLYTKCYNAPVYSEGFMLGKISKFTLALKESTEDLSNIALLESNDYSNSVNGVIDQLNKVIGNVREVKTTLLKAISDTKASIEKDGLTYKVLDNHAPYEINTMVSKALNGNEIYSSDISTTSNFINGFPNNNCIGENLFGMIKDTIDNHIIKVIKFDNNMEDQEAAESLANKIDNIQDDILSKVFVKYPYDKTDITGSVIKVSSDAFGSEDRIDKPITIEMFSNACYNLNNRQQVIDVLDKDYQEVESNYSSIIVGLESIKSEVLKMYEKIPRNYEMSVNANINGRLSTVVSNLNSIINTLNIVINANYKLLMNKVLRINQIYNPDPAYGDSAKIKKACLELIKEPDTSAEVNGLEASQESFDMFDDFECMLSLLDEVYAEEDFSSTITLAINEAEGDATKPATANTSGTLTDKSKVEFNLVDKIIAAITNLIDKFKNRVNEVVIVGPDKDFWNNNRESFKSMTAEGFGKTTVNEWFEYDLDNFNIPIVKDFDISDPMYNSDDDCATAIIKLYDGKHKSEFADGDSFNGKLTKCFYDSYIKQDGGVLASTVVNPQKIFTFLDDFVRNNWNGETLGNVDKEWKKLQENEKKIKQNIETIVDKYADSHISEKPAAEGTPTGAKEGQTGAGQVGSGNSSPAATAQHNSAIDLSDFRFNLAEHFALYSKANQLRYLKEADEKPATPAAGSTTKPDVSPTSNTASITTDTAAANYQQSNDNSGRKDTKKAAQKCIERYSRYNGYALTTRTSVVFAAYKQYMALYKSLRELTPNKKSAGDVQDKESKVDVTKKTEEKK